jgi:polysaccharide biosynthesis transport protein
MSENPMVISDLGAILRRRKLHAAIPAALILLLSGALAYILPPVYVSTATILIEQQEIPKDLVASTVTGYAAERVERVRSRVMTRDNLWAIAEEFDLYPGERSIETQQDIVSRMRGAIALNLVSAEALDPRSGRPVTATIAFSVSTESESPALAQQITARLSELYLEENRRSREENAQQTSSFLNDEAQRLSGRIAELEEKIAAFKIRSGGYSPEYFQTTSRSLEDAQRQLGVLDARLAPFGIAILVPEEPVDRFRVIRTACQSACGTGCCARKILRDTSRCGPFEANGGNTGGRGRSWWNVLRRRRRS